MKINDLVRDKRGTPLLSQLTSPLSFLSHFVGKTKELTLATSMLQHIFLLLNTLKDTK